MSSAGVEVSIFIQRVSLLEETGTGTKTSGQWQQLLMGVEGGGGVLACSQQGAAAATPPPAPRPFCLSAATL